MWVRTPNWIQRMFPRYIWRLPATNNEIYLTFDDGPTPEVTPQVLDLLFSCQAKATFFCLGKNVEKYPELAARIRVEGHTLANHGYNHISGFFCSTRGYAANAQKGAEITKSKLFRPPYGRVMPWQARKLLLEFRIIQWNVMSMDFKKDCSGEQCYSNVINNASPGSIVVFHDTIQASERILAVLPMVLAYFTKHGFECKAIPDISAS